MKLSFCASLLNFVFISNIAFAGDSGKTFAKSHDEQIPGICFIENKGQVHDQNYLPRPDVLYMASDNDLSLQFKKTGISYQINRVDRWKETKTKFRNESRTLAEEETFYRVDFSWLNSKSSFDFFGENERSDYTNYYLQNCPDGTVKVKSYNDLKLTNIYDGISLHYYEKAGHFKHDYIVAPHADYHQIQIKVEGAEISLDEGALILITPLGKIREDKPVVFQNGRQLEACWQIKNDILSFEIKNYNSNYELIIDPVTRLWGTYNGGAAQEYNFSCATDSSHNVYMAGYTNSSNAIATSGAHQTTYSGGINFDSFLAKFDVNGVRLWATYYGGTGEEYVNSCATDIYNNIYIAGETRSSSGGVIGSVGSHQMNYGGGPSDAFLVKFDQNGIRQWGTYYGSSSYDISFCCTTDIFGNVYLAGWTSSTNGIATTGSHQSSHGGAVTDAYLVKFNSAGVRQWGTYYGGTGEDMAYACAADPAGNIYLAGFTNTNTGTIIATPGSHQPVTGQNEDGFLVKFDNTGTRLWGTYYGGPGNDHVYACTTDLNANVFITGETGSGGGTVIATANSHQPNIGGGGPNDSYLAKFNSSGVRQWGTFYGGTGDDFGYDCVTDGSGNVFLGGFTNSNNGTTIATVGSHQPLYGGGATDAFLTKFDASGVRQWGTYYGGAGSEREVGCAKDITGIYLTGHTTSNTGTIIATPGSHQSTHGGSNWDAYLVKFDDCDLAPQAPNITGSNSVCVGGAANFTINTFGASSYTWSMPNGWNGSGSFSTYSAMPGASGIFTITSNNSCGASPQTTIFVNVVSVPTITAFFSAQQICKGDVILLNASGAQTYSVYPNSAIANGPASPNITTTYTVLGSNAIGCVNSVVLTLIVNECTNIAEISNQIQKIMLYPNPNNGNFTLSLESDCQMTITSVAGTFVYSHQLIKGLNLLNLEHLKSGTYFIQLKSEDILTTVKLIKN